MTPDQRLAKLDRLLAEMTDEDDGMLLAEFDGFCTALVIGPEMILPSEWLPIVWGGDGSTPEFQSAKELQHALQLMMEHYNDVVSLLSPPDEQFSPVYDHDERNDEPYWETWVSGFERAMRLRPDAWADIAEAADGNPSQDVKMSVGMILELAALADGTSELTDEQTAAITVDVPNLVANIVFNIQSWTSAQRPAEPFPSTASASMVAPSASSRKIGRNDPCPCGSGRKYKKCCGAN
ncbi:UPF0149 family protein [Roseovarius tibetensis]|uniref:UPF0149 family protein n=1 Tax=Roseovarius tibetensis TaxID=2685897 RepID=UPI003D7F3AD7